jgi:thymidylate kinase
MYLIMIGCEYAGKTTLATEISKWMIDAMGLNMVVWHDHYVVPGSASSSTSTGDHLTILKPGTRQPDTPYGAYVIRDPDAEDPQDKARDNEVLGLSPWLLEQLQRNMIWRHLHHGMVRDKADYLSVNFYYADAVYAPLYYGFGEPGSFADRTKRARHWDAEMLQMAPDTVLVLVKASAEAIRERMRARPRTRALLKESDVGLVLDRFEEEYENSLIQRRLSLDTTDAPVEDTLAQFVDEIRPHMSQMDLLRIVSQRGSP